MFGTAARFVLLRDLYCCAILSDYVLLGDLYCCLICTVAQFVLVRDFVLLR
jgi:hypothetical protein